MLETTTDTRAHTVPPLTIVPPVPPIRLSADLETLRIQYDERSLSIGDLEASLKGRGFALLLVLLSLPFCLMLPLPGLSLPFGIAVFLFGGRMAFGQSPWLPQFIRRISFSAGKARLLLNACIKFARGMEKIARPRMHFLQKWPGMMNLIGVGIAIAGFLLLLPLPIPFSNAFPAWGIVLLAAGMIERDGLFVLLGYLTTIASWVFCILFTYFGWDVVDRLWNWFFH